MVAEPILNDLEGGSRVVMQVNAVTSVWLDVGLKSTSIWERWGDRDVGNAGSGSASSEAVTSAVDVVIFTSQDEHRTGESRHVRGDGEGKDFAKGDGLFGLFGKYGEADIKVAWEEECVDVGGQVGPGQITGW